MTIPKQIFYVWDGPLSDQAERCIASWQCVMPDYKILEVNNASPYFDLQGELARCSWFRAVFERRFWAYIADYIRVKTLLDHGGIYCDTDITALKRFDPLLNHKFFAGFESSKLVNLSIFGCVSGHSLLEDMYTFYQEEIWHTPLYTIPEIVTCLLVKKYGCILYDSRVNPEVVNFGPVTLYPERSFYPYRYDEIYDERCVTESTYTTHWWGASWGKPEVLRWLNAKHLTGLVADPERATITDFLRHTPKELKVEVRFLGLSVLRGFRQGCFHVYEVLGLPLVAVQWLGKSATYFLFNRFKLFTRKQP